MEVRELLSLLNNDFGINSLHDIFVTLSDGRMFSERQGAERGIWNWFLLQPLGIMYLDVEWKKSINK